MKKIILLFAIAAGTFQLNSQTKDETQKAARVDSILTAYTAKNMFNGSVLVAKSGKVLLSKGYGYASFEFGIANKPETKFKLGSVTKQFTAMAIMILEEQGKLSVTDPVSKFIPDYPHGNKITIHQLLNHTSGVSSITANPRFDSIKMFPHTIEEVIACFRSLPLDFEPGSRFQYSNSGYILLSYIIEKTSGVSYGEFVSKNIFEKLGMKNSGYCINSMVVSDFAQGYSQTAVGYVRCDYIDMSIPLGAGALYSTTVDMYLWDRALYTEKLVKKSTREKIFTPSADGIGYGWFIHTINDKSWIFHRGRIEGFSTQINRFPDQDMCIIILKNVDNQTYFDAGEITMQVMFGDKFELPVEHKVVKVDPAVFRNLTGKFQLDSGFYFTVTDSIGKLFIQAPDEPQFELLPEGELNYFLLEVNATIEFVMGKDGTAESLVLRQGGQEVPMLRIK
jgi:CubicO group peptidase (beta-lactamase class C family)